MSKSKIYVLLLLSVCYGLFVNVIYRPYVFNHNHYDYLGLASMGSNLVFVPIMSSFREIFSKKHTNNSKKDPYTIFFVLCLGEVLSFFIPALGTFDYKDIIGLAIGLLITKLVL